MTLLAGPPLGVDEHPVASVDRRARSHDHVVSVHQRQVQPAEHHRPYRHALQHRELIPGAPPRPRAEGRVPVPGVELVGLTERERAEPHGLENLRVGSPVLRRPVQVIYADQQVLARRDDAETLRKHVLHHRAPGVHGRLRVEPHGLVEAPLQVGHLRHVLVRGEGLVPENLVELGAKEPELLGVLGLQELVRAPREHRRGGLVSGDEQREQVVSQLRRRNLLPRGDEVPKHGRVGVVQVVPRPLLRAADLLLFLHHALAVIDELGGHLLDDLDGVLRSLLPGGDHTQERLGQSPRRQQVHGSGLHLLQRRVRSLDHGRRGRQRLEVVVEHADPDDVERSLGELGLHVQPFLLATIGVDGGLDELNHSLGAGTETPVHHRLHVPPVQRRRDGFAADLPRLVLLQRDAEAEEELASLRDGALDVLGPVVEEDLLDAVGVGDDDVGRDRPGGEEVHGPRLLHPLEQRLEEAAAQQSGDVLQLRIRDGNLRVAAPEAVELGEPVGRGHRGAGALLVGDGGVVGKLGHRELDVVDVVLGPGVGGDGLRLLD